jgi:hypothetical protein
MRGNKNYKNSNKDIKCFQSILTLLEGESKWQKKVNMFWQIEAVPHGR